MAPWISHNIIDWFLQVWSFLSWRFAHKIAHITITQIPNSKLHLRNYTHTNCNDVHYNWTPAHITITCITIIIPIAIITQMCLHELQTLRVDQHKVKINYWNYTHTLHLCTVELHKLLQMNRFSFLLMKTFGSYCPKSAISQSALFKIWRREPWEYLDLGKEPQMEKVWEHET